MSIDWTQVRRVLVVKLRSIGDTVLATPSLIALRRHLPDAQIDILLEDWVAPVLDGLDVIDNIVVIRKGITDRLQTAVKLRQTRYDVVFNLHGGTTATFLTFATGARHRIGLSSYQYPFLYTDLLSSPADYWGRPGMHSAEQQLALIGHAGVPIDGRINSRLAVTRAAAASVESRLKNAGINSAVPFALIHPAAAFETKTWSIDNFARTAEHLNRSGLTAVAIAAAHEADVLTALAASATVPISTFTDLTLPEITALASRARLFVGNDSGVAHIAAAVGTPSVVIFGSSNRVHWHPWTDAPYELVFNEMECQPCAGYRCEVFGQPRCILEVPVKNVADAIERVLQTEQAASGRE